MLMKVKTLRILSAGVLLALLVFTAPATEAAAFAIFEQGAKAMGMAGAFAAQADDPSAMYYNPGGLAMFSERSFYGGASAVRLGDVDFTGLAPFPGPGQTGTQRSQTLLVPHFYWVEPLRSDLNLGVGINAPFGLTTEWDNPDQWSGRFISEKAALRAIDLNLALGWRVNKRTGLAFGIIVRNSDLELRRRKAANNPFTQTTVDVARVKLEGGFDRGYGFTFGVLQKINDRISWGLAYRSQIDVDYSGDATFTQIMTGNATFDAIVAAALPANQPVDTGIDFPERATLGFAYRAADELLVEIDAIWWGWSSFASLDLTFPNTPDGSLNQSFAEEYDDSMTFRLGLSWNQSDIAQWRFGYYIDESPQPAESTGPLLPDADRQGLTVGYGRRGDRLQWDFYLLYVMLDDRTTTVNRDNFDGKYEGTTLLLGATVGW